MSDLSKFPITARWPAQHPERLQLYSLPTPNGVKVSIMLEEIGLPYEPHTINIGKNETFTPAFLSLNQIYTLETCTMNRGKYLPNTTSPSGLWETCGCCDGLGRLLAVLLWPGLLDTSFGDCPNRWLITL